MFGLERLVVVLVCHPSLAATNVLKREVRAVAAVAEREDVIGARLYAFEERVDRHAGPRRVELRPLRDAVDVDREGLRGEGEQLLPRPRARRLDRAANAQAPVGGRVDRGRPGGEDGEVAREVLARREPLRLGGRPALEAA